MNRNKKENEQENQKEDEQKQENQCSDTMLSSCIQELEAVRTHEGEKKTREQKNCC